MLYTNDFNHVNYVTLQLATIIYGREFENLIKTIFFSQDDESSTEDEIANH